jgi:hypothetical protein
LIVPAAVVQGDEVLAPLDDWMSVGVPEEAGFENETVEVDWEPEGSMDGFWVEVVELDAGFAESGEVAAVLLGLVTEVGEPLDETVMLEACEEDDPLE